LKLAHEAGLVQLGAWATDGSKFPGNASRHKAMSYGYMQKEEERLKAEIAELLKQQLQQDEAEDAALGSRRGDELPDELRFREERLAKILQAKTRLQEQARAEAEAQRQRRAQSQQEVERGDKHAGGRPPSSPISEVPDDKAQTSFTDPQMKIMPQSNKGWDYGVNAQVVVDDACQIIIAASVVIETNDKQQAVPMARMALANLEQAGIQGPVDERGERQKIVGVLDTGYYSEKAVSGLEALGFDPYVATGRQKHHAPIGPVPAEPLAAKAPAKEKMAAKLQTAVGQAVYGLRKGIVEPVFGQIKAARGFRRFSLRGLVKVSGEWSLVCLTHNLLKLWRYDCVPNVH
jgi:hypothetical protein